ncbi:MAG: HAD family hydrolase [Desulfovermiculus sp.]
MSSTRRAVFFDLDGTLLNTISDLAASMNQVLAQWGCPVHPEEKYRYFIGDGVHMLATRALPLPMRTESRIEQAVQAFRQVYSRRWKETTRPYPGITSLLQALGEQKISLGVVSNKPHEPTLTCVQTFFPQVSFVVVQGQTQGLPPKPDPAGLIAALKACGADGHQSLYLGDSGVDVQAAKGAGMWAVGAEWGFRTREELEEHGAEHVVRHPLDVLEIAQQIWKRQENE